LGSFPAKIIGVFLAFILMVFAPIITVTLVDDIKIERRTWNYLTDFTDIASDKGVLTENDYTEFVTKLGATTVDYEVLISVQHKLVLPGQNAGEYTVRYTTSGLWKSAAGGVTGDFYMEAGDNLQVILRPLTSTAGDKILQAFLKFSPSNVEYSYSANVRNNGR